MGPARRLPLPGLGAAGLGIISTPGQSANRHPRHRRICRPDFHPASIGTYKNGLSLVPAI
jgi:hypothetical protein